MELLDWMQWTRPTAIFFAAIATMLAGMTLWQFVQPSAERKGLLPIATTRGDRLFIGLLTNAYWHLGYLAAGFQNLWIALAIGIAWMILVLRFG